MRLRLMTYNVKGGMFHPQGLEAVAAVIRTARPDLVALQEVDLELLRTGRVDQSRWLGKRLGMEACFGPALLRPEEGGAYGNAVLLRDARLLAAESLALPLPEYRAEADPSWREPRGALTVLLDFAGEKLWLVCTHLGLEPGQRGRQAEFLARLVLEELEPPTVLAGDFNAGPGDVELQPLAELEASHLLLEPAARTFPSGPPGDLTEGGRGGLIDHIFAHGPRLRAAEVIWDRSLASDHNPLLVELEA